MRLVRAPSFDPLHRSQAAQAAATVTRRKLMSRMVSVSVLSESRRPRAAVPLEQLPEHRETPVFA
jgi:hypothetical protein